MSLRIALFIFLQFVAVSAFALPLDCYTFVGCGGGRSSSASANPSNGNQIRINPSAVPTEKAFGLEGIYYNGDTDFSIAQGLGRVGAAISPSNSEETFFGPPGLEIEADMLERKQTSEKYPSQKYNFATAVDVIKRKGSGIKSYGFKLGVIAKYNKLTKTTHGGGGATIILGPFVFGGSAYNDETLLDYARFGINTQELIKYQVTAYSGGISLGSLLVDYSVLQMKEEESERISTVRLVNASLLVKKIILTASKRTEDSERLAYNYSTRALEPKQIKDEIFGGLQVNATQNFMVGVLYNYYLLHETSITATLFF